jgi:uncharacterized protein
MKIARTPSNISFRLVLLKGSSALLTYLRNRAGWSNALSPETSLNHSLPNHLAGEKSPYLQQHAHNPVDWYPWGDEAFRRAMEEHKPVFLSIGYATCHWCHVMAHESFEDPGIAAILNASFIAVKVDREERPDIDSVYMTACQQMTGQGGWPLTIIMTPDKKPFFAGTYLPRTTRAGMTGLSELLMRVIRLWQEQRDMLVSSAEELTSRLAVTCAMPAEGRADKSLLRTGYDELVRSFDPVNGGFGQAPKFPTPTVILFLLRFWKHTGSDQALGMAEKTLVAISSGGIHDHLGGGFHRYSTDKTWRVPHFEKMLYDQALLLMAFTEAWLATKKPLYRNTAEDIITYVARDLISPEGAFISAEDADSPGGEGAYYVWTRKELDEILGPSDGPFAARLFGVEEGGNFFSSESGPGKNILYRKAGNPEINGNHSWIISIQQKLLAERQKRPRPVRDGKILADWNGLMIAALAQSSRAFDNPDCFRMAETAMHVILNRLRIAGGGLLHRYCDGDAAIPAFADDYAFVIRALIELYETSFDPVWLREALNLNQYVRRHFSDSDGCGFFTTPDDGEILIARKKEIYDGALPSCNSMMLTNLVLLAHLTGDPVHEEQASRLADGFAGIVRRSPSAYSAYLCGLDYLLGPAADVVITGRKTDREAEKMVRLICGEYYPSVTLHFLTPESSHALEAVAPFTRAMTEREGRTTAYVCSGRTCSAPVTDPDLLRKELGEKRKGVIRGS